MEPLAKNIELFNLRAMFYLVTPNETSFEHLSEVPYYTDKVIPFFFILIILEFIINKIRGREVRFNDGVNSFSHGMLSQLPDLTLRPVELIIYAWLYEHYRFVDLPWNNPWVWFLAFIGVDFTYYWFHRWSHEVNIIWASHQVHHSSEDYNLTTALRQSATQKYYSMVFHFGLAFFMPPPIFYVHRQFNILYQFWLHTELVNTIGPLEYILNTPSHHRVHHGRNPYCIDKNYAGTLIIWDRIFNTFQAEDKKVIYGLVHPNKFWNPIKGQIQHYLWILHLVRTQKGIKNKLAAVFYGPGWQPGKPRTGLLSDIPEVKEPVQKYNSDIPAWANVYVVVHSLLTVFGYTHVAQVKETLTAFYCLACIVFFIVSISCFGALYDNSKYSSIYECLQCVMFMVYAYHVRGADLLQSDFISGMFVVYTASAVLLLILTCLQYRLNVVTKKSE